MKEQHSRSPPQSYNFNNNHSRSRIHLTEAKNTQEPYIPVTYMSISNQKDFTRISNLISNTYDAQVYINDESTTTMTKQLRTIGRNFDSYQTKLKSQPFGRFLGDKGVGAERNKIHNFDLPFHRIGENRPLIE